MNGPSILSDDSTYEMKADMQVRDVPLIGYNTILGKIDLDLTVVITGRQLKTEQDFLNKFSNVQAKNSFLKRMVSMKRMSKDKKSSSSQLTLLLAGRQQFDL